jgi:hypothetical protein
MAPDTPAMNEPPRGTTPLDRPVRFFRLLWQDLAGSLGPVVILSAIVILVTLHYVSPAPPTRLTMTSGPAGSSFSATAERYRKILARNGITLRILASAGSLENLNRLADPHSGVDI